MKARYIDVGADISGDGVYRHGLWRSWDHGKNPLVYIMLNPSTADANVDDPTIRKCVHYAVREGYGGIRVVNLFDLRATNPYKILKHEQPNSDVNDFILEKVIKSYPTIICAWGANADHPKIKERAVLVSEMLEHNDHINVLCLGTTKWGHPLHPLMTRNDQPLVAWPGYGE